MLDTFIFSEHERLPVKIKEAAVLFAGEADKHDGQGRIFNVSHIAPHDKASISKQNDVPTKTLSDAFEGKLPSIDDDREKTDLATKQFAKSELWPWLLNQKSIYAKDSEGGGGHNITRFFVRQGMVFVETTNHASSLLLSTMDYAKNHDNYVPPDFWIEPKKYGVDSRKTRFFLGKTNAAQTADFFSDTVLQVVRLSSIPEPAKQLDNVIFQAEIPALKSKGKPLEFRFFVQKTRFGYKVTHHYAKIGANRFTSNYSQGGRLQESQTELEGAIMDAYTSLNQRQARAMARKFIRESLGQAQAQLNKDRAALRNLTIVETEPRVFEVKAPPILATVDFVAQIKGETIKPTKMEVHYSGDFSMTEDAESGLIPKRTWKKIISLHSRNLKQIIREATTKVKRIA